jgi:hypothetical protein
MVAAEWRNVWNPAAREAGNAQAVQRRVQNVPSKNIGIQWRPVRFAENEIARRRMSRVLFLNR